MTTYTLKALPDGRDVFFATIKALDNHLLNFPTQQEFALTIHTIDKDGKETDTKKMTGVQEVIFDLVESKHQI